MFEATLYADHDHKRLQRLLLAAAVTLAATATSFAVLWTLERMNIDRIGGPNSQNFELTQLSLLPPPKLIDPPPPPPVMDGGEESKVEGPAPRGEILEEVVGSKPEPDSTRDPLGDAAATAERSSSGIPTGPGCPGPGCGNSLIPTRPSDTCVGPRCGDASKPAVVGDAPASVAFSQLKCFACAGPDQTLLRKTGAGVRKRSGTVAARFCVDLHGRVEAGSIEISQSFGDAGVDTITRKAIARWRFSPMKVAGVPRRACSRAKFDIEFQ